MRLNRAVFVLCVLSGLLWMNTARADAIQDIVSRAFAGLRIFGDADTVERRPSRAVADWAARFERAVRTLAVGADNSDDALADLYNLRTEIGQVLRITKGQELRENVALDDDPMAYMTYQISVMLDLVREKPQLVSYTADLLVARARRIMSAANFQIAIELGYVAEYEKEQESQLREILERHGLRFSKDTVRRLEALVDRQRMEQASNDTKARQRLANAVAEIQERLGADRSNVLARLREALDETRSPRRQSAQRPYSLGYLSAGTHYARRLLSLLALVERTSPHQLSWDDQKLHETVTYFARNTPPHSVFHSVLSKNADWTGVLRLARRAITRALSR